MASSTSLALRRLISSSVVPRSVRPAASLRLFNTNAARSYEEGDNRNHRPNRTVSPRGGDFFSGSSSLIHDSFVEKLLNRSIWLWFWFMWQTCLHQRGAWARCLISWIRSAKALCWHHQERDVDGTWKRKTTGCTWGSICRGWAETREDVKLALEQNTLVIKGEGKTEEGDEDDGRKFSSRIGLPEKVYKTDEIKAEMKNGVLKVVVPKLKEDERYNVRHIQVD